MLIQRIVVIIALKRALRLQSSGATRTFFAGRRRRRAGKKARRTHDRDGAKLGMMAREAVKAREAAKRRAVTARGPRSENRKHKNSKKQ